MTIFQASLLALLSCAFIVGIIYNWKKMLTPNPKLLISKQAITYYFVRKDDFITIPFPLITNMSLSKVDTEELDHEYSKQMVKYIYLIINCNTKHPNFAHFKENNHKNFHYIKEDVLRLNIYNIALFKTKKLEQYLENITK